MTFNQSESSSSTALIEKIDAFEKILTQIQSYFQKNRPAVIPPYIYERLSHLEISSEQIRELFNKIEEQRKNLQSLADIGQLLSTTLDLNEVLKITMDIIIQITQAERGFLMLRDESGSFSIRIARNFEQESIGSEEIEISQTIVQRSVDTRQPILSTNAKEDPRFQDQKSIIAYNLRSILCVPIMVKGEIIGAIYADHRVKCGIFSQKDADLLTAFSNQAGVAIENARLFKSINLTLAEATELKNLMQNVFASIASGVITIDIQGRVTICNQAAEQILRLSACQMIGKSLIEISPSLDSQIHSHLIQVIEFDHPRVGLEIKPIIPGREITNLMVSLSPLKNINSQTEGVAIVLEDYTEKKKLEAESRLFEKMVSPAVINQLNFENQKLGGRRTTITVLFADIRGFTSFSEGLIPEQLVSVLNIYLASAADAILAEDGTIDKFLGDAVMSWFNAPISQPDHPLRAIRAAISICKLVDQLHRSIPKAYHLSFGIGIHTGEAIMGLIGTEKRLEYTAIGDCVNTAKRIQESALGGQILISHETYEMIQEYVLVKPIQSLVAKGKKAPLTIYEILGLKVDSGQGPNLINKLKEEP
jgi:adenylate cyclase